MIVFVTKVDLFDLILGLSLEDLGKLKEAIKSYEECNKISPETADSYIHRVKDKLKRKKNELN